MAETQAAQPQSYAPDAAAAPALLDQIVAEGRLGRGDEAARDRGRELVRRFVEQVLEGAITVGRDTEAMVNARIAQIDDLISRQLNAVMHAPQFQKLEGTWRGLKYLISQTETSDKLKIKVLNVSKKELLKDLRGASEFDQSALFKRVYEEEYGTLGGAPFSAMVGDYEFDRGGQDVELLERISQVAAAAHAPFLTAAAPAMFDMDSFSQLDQPRDLAKIFDTTEYAKWKAFRQTEDSRYVALTCPRVLLRVPYGPGENEEPVEAFDFHEHVTGRAHDDYLWGNAAWALAARVTNAFALSGWCAMIRGVEGGGRVEGLPVHTFQTDAGETVLKCPTEVQLTDRREHELANLGFVGLVHEKETPNAVFLSVQSGQKPKLYDTPSATANARLSAQLPYIFAVSRFAHYLKVMMRDKIGSYTSRAETEAFLNRWISNYVVGNADAPISVKAKRPLSDARVEVAEVPGKPGAYRAIAYLRPHFQLDEINISMRLVAELPSAK
ncbi:type VI secretion protein EvpB [Gemmatimonadetes bacterium T265]|nr:type VI secretion protein EvpB [Gemmatimonadetes bacterium T265]